LFALSGPHSEARLDARAVHFDMPDLSSRLLQVMDSGARVARVDIEVAAEGMGDAAVKAGEIARRVYGDTAQATGIITYFRTRISPGMVNEPPPGG
jgi:hypothetical protein